MNKTLLFNRTSRKMEVLIFYLISTINFNIAFLKKVKVHNSGKIHFCNGNYRDLTERERFKLIGFVDEDFKKSRTLYPKGNGTTL